MTSRYAGVREAYFTGGSKPPPVPPKQANEYNGAGKSRSPSDSPNHALSPSSSPGHFRPSFSPSHYLQHSHSVPRNRNRIKAKQGGGGVKKSPDRSVGRSSSFSHAEVPPVIPPRPVATPPSIPKTFKRAQPKFLTGDLAFEELIKHYQKSFPLRIYITNGYMGATARLTISTGDMYNIHFIKRTKVMLFKDTHDTPYSIPLNSAIEFGLLFQPKQGRKPTDVEAGIVFSSVADLLSQPETPRVVSVMKTWQSSDRKTSLVTNEVLFVKSTQKSMFGKKGVKVFSLTTKSDKFLTEECTTQFSTQPSACRLHITDIVDHVKQPKGDKCLLFLNSQVLMNREMSSSLQTIPDDLFDKVLTIVDLVTETSLIASSLLYRRANVSAEEYDPDRDVLFDIPVDENTAEMTCAVMDIPNPTDTDRLYDDTKSLYEKFDPTKVMTIKDTGSADTHAAQKLLYTTIRVGCEGLGVELDRPEGVYASVRRTSSAKVLPLPPLPPPPPPVPVNAAPPSIPNNRSPVKRREIVSDEVVDGSDCSSLEYDEVTPESLQLTHQTQMPNLHTVSVARPHKEDVKLMKKIDELQKVVGENETEMVGLHSRLDQSLSRVNQLEKTVATMRSTIDTLVNHVSSLQASLNVTSQRQDDDEKKGAREKDERGGVGGGGGGMDEVKVMEENKLYLRSLSSHEVRELLGVMELHQYQESFIRESVSGEILADCDNDILLNDLGVASRLHRLRLMKVVSGRHSAACLIQGADPYVTLDKK